MKAKILIADDERDLLLMLGRFFEGKGFRVLPAGGGHHPEFGSFRADAGGGRTV